MVVHTSLDDGARSMNLAPERTLMTAEENASQHSSHPRIALITPLRDEEKFIEALIISIINQQVRPDKWLIVDDGSTDTTPAIVQKYCREFHFIEFLQLP